MVFEALQQLPPEQLFEAHVAPGSVQQPKTGMVPSQSDSELVESCATWQPYFQALSWKPEFPDLGNDASGNDRLAMQLVRAAAGGGNGGGGDGGGGDGGGGDGSGGRLGCG